VTESRAAAAFDLLFGILETQNPYFIGHAARVADLAASIGAGLGLEDSAIDELRIAGRLHDLGMVAVPTNVLTAAGPLSAADSALVRMHPTIGARILSTIVSPTIEAAIRGHHERWDGKGYPDGQSGASISLGARILAAAEIFDAMISPRAYRGALSEEEALLQLSGLRGTALDPAIVQATIAAVRTTKRLAFLPDLSPAGADIEPGARHVNEQTLLERSLQPFDPEREAYR
jgi:HD-GYP domain-containing protein (c-di-GMP phosphodiesterase class II)